MMLGLYREGKVYEGTYVYWQNCIWRNQNAVDFRLHAVRFSGARPLAPPCYTGPNFTLGMKMYWKKTFGIATILKTR